MDERLTGLYEAHVRHELDRWRGDAVRAAAEELVAAAVDGLGTTSLRDLLPAGTATAWATGAVLEAPVPDGLAEELLLNYAWGDVRVAYHYETIQGYLLPATARVEIPRYAITGDVAFTGYRLNVPIPHGIFDDNR